MNVRNRVPHVMSIPDVKIVMDLMHVVLVQLQVNVSVNSFNQSN